MTSDTRTYAQLFLRLALSASFLSAVADRFGLWGKPGDPNVVWGNWQNFLSYSNSVNSFLPPQLGEGLAILATALEIILSLLLLAGYKLRLTVVASGLLLLGFGVAMTLSFGVKPALDYSVWTDAAACFVLSTFSSFPFSLDQVIRKEK